MSFHRGMTAPVEELMLPLSGSSALSLFETGCEAPEFVHFPAGLQTPRFRPTPGCFPCTPEATKRGTCTPPSLSCPWADQRRVEEDIAVGLQAGSASLVSMALLQGHCCVGRHALYEAVQRRHTDALDLLLDYGGQDLEEACHGHRPLQLAIEISTRHGDAGYRMAERLLLRGARPGAYTSDSQLGRSTPLHSAVARSNAAAVKLLLAHGADASAVDGTGSAPLHVVAQQMPSWLDLDASDGRSAREIAGVLLAHGASPFQRDDAGRTPLQSTFDPSLWDLFAELEKRWSKAALASALASAGSSQAQQKSALCVPEIFWAVGEFL